MGATLTHSCPLPYLEKNLAAIKRADLPTPALVHDAQLPNDLELVAARDGSSTYTWIDSEGRRHWLGRSPMPTVRARALIEAFSPGDGNAIFFGIGQGFEIQRLLDRLAPRQALYILEPDARSAKLCLALHDFSIDLKRGRLILLIGDDCWQQLEQFLLGNPGYLAPDRMLSWPWFDHADIHQITQRLTHACHQVALKRNTCRQALRFSAQSPGESAPNIAMLAFASNSSSDDWVRGLEWAAGQRNVRAQTFDHKSPRLVHPLATELQLAAQKPSHVFQIDMSAADLSLQVPPARKTLLISNRGELAPAAIEQLSPDTIVAVRTNVQFEQVRAKARKALHVSPAARVATSARIARGNKIIAIADRIDFSPQAAGLHLASHCSIFHAAEQSILRDIDRAHTDNADEYLTAALKHLGLALHNDEVRKGLCERISNILVPGLLTREFEICLNEASIECEFTGAAREGLGNYSSAAVCDDTQVGLVLFIHPHRQDACAILDAIAAGIVVALRGSRPQDFEFLEGTLGDPPMVQTFSTRNEALRVIHEFESDPAAVRSRWAPAMQHVLDTHLWTHRLDALLQVCKAE